MQIQKSFDIRDLVNAVDWSGVFTDAFLIGGQSFPQILSREKARLSVKAELHLELQSMVQRLATGQLQQRTLNNPSLSLGRIKQDPGKLRVLPAQCLAQVVIDVNVRR